MVALARLALSIPLRGHNRVRVKVYGSLLLSSIALHFFMRADAMEGIARFVGANERWELDELYTLILAWSLAFLGVALHRTHQFRKELRRREAAEQLAQKLARHDTLTSLPNRRFLTEWLAARLPCKEDGCVTLLLIDLDRFKPVNDTFGHPAGDTLLREIAVRIRKIAAREKGVLARHGGDEFALAISDGRSDAALLALADSVIKAAEQPVDLGGNSVRVACSVGIAVSRAGASASELFRQADIAMYESKRKGGCSASFYRPYMDEQLRNRAALEANMRAGLARGEIVPYYQAIRRLDTGEIEGVECLARWNHPTAGLLQPCVFIPIAETAGLINELTIAILEQACVDARRWPDELTISINISPIQLRDRELPERLLALLERHHFPARRLIIEVTENMVLSDVDTARPILAELRAAGIRIALDDFGAGFWGLSHFRDLKFDRIKIDRSFVSDLDNHDNAEIVKAIISLGRGLGLSVTAEGVETGSRARELVDLGCTYAQGYYWGRPAPAASLFTMVNEPA